MKLQIALFALVASLLSGCGGDTQLYVGHLTSVWTQGGVRVGGIDDSRASAYVYLDNRSQGVVIDRLARDPLYFDRHNTDLSLDDSRSDGSFEDPIAGYSESWNYTAGTGTLSGSVLQVEVKAIGRSDERDKTESFDVVYTFIGYIQAGRE